MAKGDTNDVVNRLQAVLPPWFPDLANAPILNAILTGIGDSFSSVFDLLQFAKLQTRIKSSTGAWLDLTAWDFFGARFRRRNGESDALFKPRLLAEIVRPRATRAAVSKALLAVTGNAPVIVEAFNPGDCGGYSIPGSGYGMAGCYGSLAYPNQIFITAIRPNAIGIPNVGGYGQGGVLGYGVAGEYTDKAQSAGSISDDDIYAAVAQTVAAGVTGWTAIVSKLPDPPPFITFDMDTVTADSGETMDEY